MTENMKKFLEALAAKDEANKINDASTEEIVALAAQMGIELSDADIGCTQELSDDEVEAAVGGNSDEIYTPKYRVGQFVRFTGRDCPHCGSRAIAGKIRKVFAYEGGCVYLVEACCPEYHHMFEHEIMYAS